LSSFCAILDEEEPSGLLRKNQGDDAGKTSGMVIAVSCISSLIGALLPMWFDLRFSPGWPCCSRVALPVRRIYSSPLTVEFYGDLCSLC